MMASWYAGLRHWYLPYSHNTSISRTPEHCGSTSHAVVDHKTIE